MEIKTISAKTIVLNREALRKFNEKEIEEIKLPFIMILGG